MRNRPHLITGLILALIVALSLPVLLAAQTSNLLEYAQPVDGALASGEVHTYTFEASEGDRPIIIMNAKGGEIDPFLRLLNPAGEVLAEDDNSNGKFNARIDGLTLSADGTYTVEAQNIASGGGGNYSLIINEASQIIAFHGEALVGEDDTFELPEVSGPLGYELSRPWPYTDLTYSLLNTLPGFNEGDIRQVIAQSFQSWANDSPLTFQEISGQNADIIISFDRIDGSSRVLGQACPPSSPCAGEVIFDVDENWILYEPEFYDEISLLGVASHEFGHAIGLLHSSDASALMYAQYSPYNLQPSRDDIAGLQRLYGGGTGGVFTTPVPGGVAPPPAEEGELQVQSVIDDSQYVEFWDFDVVAGEDVTISMQALSGGLDPLIIIIDANDNVLAYDDDSAEGLNAVIRNISFPQSGTYTVAATRFEQAQGYTAGEYVLSIIYGTTTDESAPPPPQATPATAATSAPAGNADGSARVSPAREADLQNATPLETALDRTFVDSTTPITQSSTGIVFNDQTYLWSVTWCARDEITLNENLRLMNVTFAVNGQPVDAGQVTRINSSTNDLNCALYAVLLSDWQGSRVSLTSTLSMNAPVFDGMTVYSAGDYVYQYDLSVR